MRLFIDLLESLPERISDDALIQLIHSQENADEILSSLDFHCFLNKRSRESIRANHFESSNTYYRCLSDKLSSNDIDLDQGPRQGAYRGETLLYWLLSSTVGVDALEAMVASQKTHSHVVEANFNAGPEDGEDKGETGWYLLFRGSLHKGWYPPEDYSLLSRLLEHHNFKERIAKEVDFNAELQVRGLEGKTLGHLVSVYRPVLLSQFFNMPIRAKLLTADFNKGPTSGKDAGRTIWWCLTDQEELIANDKELRRKFINEADLSVGPFRGGLASNDDKITVGEHLILRDQKLLSSLHSRQRKQVLLKLARDVTIPDASILGAKWGWFIDSSEEKQEIFLTMLANEMTLTERLLRIDLSADWGAYTENKMIGSILGQKIFSALVQNEANLEVIIKRSKQNDNQIPYARLCYNLGCCYLYREGFYVASIASKERACFYFRLAIENNYGNDAIKKISLISHSSLTCQYHFAASQNNLKLFLTEGALDKIVDKLILLINDETIMLQVKVQHLIESADLLFALKKEAVCREGLNLSQLFYYVASRLEVDGKLSEALLHYKAIPEGSEYYLKAQEACFNIIYYSYDVHERAVYGWMAAQAYRLEADLSINELYITDYQDLSMPDSFLWQGRKEAFINGAIGIVLQRNDEAIIKQLITELEYALKKYQYSAILINELKILLNAVIKEKNTPKKLKLLHCFSDFMLEQSVEEQMVVILRAIALSKRNLTGVSEKLSELKVNHPQSFSLQYHCVFCLDLPVCDKDIFEKLEILFNGSRPSQLLYLLIEDPFFPKELKEEFVRRKMPYLNLIMQDASWEEKRSLSQFLFLFKIKYELELNIDEMMALDTECLSQFYDVQNKVAIALENTTDTPLIKCAKTRSMVHQLGCMLEKYHYGQREYNMTQLKFDTRIPISEIESSLYDSYAALNQQAVFFSDQGVNVDFVDSCYRQFMDVIGKKEAALSTSSFFSMQPEHRILTKLKSMNNDLVTVWVEQTPFLTEQEKRYLRMGLNGRGHVIEEVGSNQFALLECGLSAIFAFNHCLSNVE